MQSKYKCKIFKGDYNHIERLEKSVNLWLEENPSIEIFNTSLTNSGYSHNIAVAIFYRGIN